MGRIWVDGTGRSLFADAMRNNCERGGAKGAKAKNNLQFPSRALLLEYEQRAYAFRFRKI